MTQLRAPVLQLDVHLCSTCLLHGRAYPRSYSIAANNVVSAGSKMSQAETDGDVQSSLLPILNGAPSASPAKSLAWDMQRGFPSVLSAILAALLVCFVLFTKYSDSIDTEEFYMYYVHVAIMIFVGFGFLMTFLKRYSLGAVSLNFVASCMMMLAGILLV